MSNENQVVTINNLPFSEDVNSKRNGRLGWFINKRAGREVSNTPSQTALLNQAKLIQSELNELFENIAKGDIETMRDDLGDILITTYGFEGLIPLNIDVDYRTDVEANLSRIDVTYEDAVITQEKYLKNGVKTEIHKTIVDQITYFPVRTINETQKGLNGEIFTPNKFAKSHLFREPVYPKLSEEIKIVMDIEEKYILQNTEQSHDGGHAVFWKKGDIAYTANLNEAKQFTLEEAEKTAGSSHKGKFIIFKYEDMLKLSEPKIKLHKVKDLK